MINLHKKPSIGFMVCRTSRGCDEKTLNWWFYLITFRNLKENNNEQMRFIKLLYIAIKIFIIYWEQSKNIRSCVFEEHVWLLDYYFFKIFFLKHLQYSYKNKHGLIILRRRQMNLNLLLQYYYDLFYLVTLFDFITIVVDNKKTNWKLNLYYLLLKISVELYVFGQVVQFLSKLDVTIFLDGSKSTHIPECIHRHVNANEIHSVWWGKHYKLKY